MPFPECFLKYGPIDVNCIIVLKKEETGSKQRASKEQGLGTLLPGETRALTSRCNPGGGRTSVGKSAVRSQTQRMRAVVRTNRGLGVSEKLQQLKTPLQ